MIVLVGFMGAGKSTVGFLLAEKLSMPFIDIDMVIERKENRSISQIFEENGEEDFRRIEHETIVRILEGGEAVVALGGGAVEHAGTREALESAFVIYLEVDYDQVTRRIGHDANRPMLARPNIGAIFTRRLPLYRQVSNMTIRTDGKQPGQIVTEIISKMTTPP